MERLFWMAVRGSSVRNRNLLQAALRRPSVDNVKDQQSVCRYRGAHFLDIQPTGSNRRVAVSQVDVKKVKVF